ncbi:MAG: MEDS domain-containing protein [Planctomycetes bacterium]|nr:MEDS domain-containing protein [Planctomycetota bacterium]
MSSTCATGIHAIGEVAWGSHFCHFFRDPEDLADTLVPYFATGLREGDLCVWVTAAPLGAEAARAALAAEVPDLDARLASGQLVLYTHEEFYALHAGRSGDEVLGSWLALEEQALRRGLRGLRLTGNTAFLAPGQYASFAEYEAHVNEAFAPRRILALCSYHLDRCGPEALLDTVRNHQFALVRRGAGWEVIENATLKQAKADLRRLADELEARVQARTAELERALRAHDDFLTVASHELRTPVTSLLLFVDGIARAARRGAVATDDLLARLDRVRAQSLRLDALVNRLLDVSRAANGRLELTPAPTDLGDAARSVCERMTDDLRRAGCALSLRVDGPAPGTWDRLRLEQVLTNLLANAVRHAPGAPVEVSVTPADGGGAALVVRDRGPGIPAGAQARLFQRFSQLDPQRSAGGFGLGLWIVHELVTAHGGEVRLESAPGEGATFRVELPGEPRAA